MPESRKDFRSDGLVLEVERRETEGLMRRTSENVTNGPVQPVLWGSKVGQLRLGPELH